MNELTVKIKARQFLESVGVNTIPVDCEQCAKAVNAEIKVKFDFDDEESGQTIPVAGKHIIVVNGNHTLERQRFTIFHEIGHIYLELPSQHQAVGLSEMPLPKYGNRPQVEILCDVFATECLLPYVQFKKDINDVEISMHVIKKLANQYQASITSTGSHFASNFSAPCAFVQMAEGKIRYVAMSRQLRDLGGWIQIGNPIPKSSVADRLLIGNSKSQDLDAIPTYIWFNNRIRKFAILSEEAMLLRGWNKCLSLLWFDDNSYSNGISDIQDINEDESIPEELDGNLSWSKL